VPEEVNQWLPSFISCCGLGLGIESEEPEPKEDNSQECIEAQAQALEATLTQEAPHLDGGQHKYFKDGTIDWFTEPDNWGYTPDDDADLEDFNLLPVEDESNIYSDASQSLHWLGSEIEPSWRFR
jgi:hypothetical protein